MSQVARVEQNTTGQFGAAPGRSWRGMYIVGGACLIATGLLFAIGAVLSIPIGPAPSDGERYLRALAQHIRLAGINFGLFTLTDFLLLPGVLALYIALKHTHKTVMLLAAALMMFYAVLDVAATELNSLTLVALARHYAASESDAQRSMFVAASAYALASLPIATFLSYVVSSVALLMASAVMLKGAFSRATAYAGMVAGIQGIAGGLYVFLPALAAFLVPSLVAFGGWCVLAGLRLNRLATS